jgi:signal transduction histidine kinase
MEGNNKETEKNNKIKRPKISVRLQVVIFVLTFLFIVIIALSIKATIVKAVSGRLYNSIKSDVIEKSEDLELILDDVDSDYSEAYKNIYALALGMKSRIILINRDFNIIFDSSNADTGKYVMNNYVQAVMNGQLADNYEAYDMYVRYIIPVTDELGNINNVAIIAESKEAVNNEVEHISNQGNTIAVIFIIFGAIFSLLISSLSIRDTVKLKKQLQGIKDGLLGEIELHHIFKESAGLVEDMNGIFNKAQMLEESRQEFVSNVSHELKTPITSMKVLSESLLMQENVPAEMYREFMNDIVSEIDREAQIISDLLTLVKTDKGKESLNIENVDINELMDVILKRLKPLAEKRNIEITFESFREVKADIDKVKLTLAISNLIENGIKYNIDGGYIRVSLNADHKSLYIKVADSGVGIPEDCVEHIFERFYRVDKARSRDTGGTGLGLAITKNIIVMHKGTINVYSEPGKGTTFTVRVPINYSAQ